jgi:hypothetical protein
VGLWAKLERQITVGESLIRILTTALPIAAVSIFVLSEVLGLTPNFLQNHSPAGLPLKYWLMIAVLVAAGVLNYTQSRSDRFAAKARGFAVDPAESAAEVGTAKAS